MFEIQTLYMWICKNFEKRGIILEPLSKVSQNVCHVHLSSYGLCEACFM